MGSQSFEDLIVWQKAMDLTTEIYQLTAAFPVEEKYGLKSQLRRAVASIPSNIAEGQGRRTAGEFLNLLSVASGSLAECQTQLYLALRLRLIEQHDCAKLITMTKEIGRLLGGLMKSLEL
jgi:four helix bundle protein